MRNAIKELCAEFGETRLVEVVINQRPVVEEMKSLEQRASQMIMEIGRL